MPKNKSCTHEYVHRLSIGTYKSIGEYGVIRSMEPIYSVCTLCGHQKSEMIGAGYVLLKVIAKDTVNEDVDG